MHEILRWKNKLVTVEKRGVHPAIDGKIYEEPGCRIEECTVEKVDFTDISSGWRWSVPLCDIELTADEDRGGRLKLILVGKEPDISL